MALPLRPCVPSQFVVKTNVFMIAIFIGYILQVLNQCNHLDNVNNLNASMFLIILDYNKKLNVQLPRPK